MHLCISYVDFFLFHWRISNWFSKKLLTAGLHFQTLTLAYRYVFVCLLHVNRCYQNQLFCLSKCYIICDFTYCSSCSILNHTLRIISLHSILSYSILNFIGLTYRVVPCQMQGTSKPVGARPSMARRESIFAYLWDIWLSGKNCLTTYQSVSSSNSDSKTQLI